MKMIFSVAFLLYSGMALSFSMKPEGACAGKLADGTSIAFEYFSNFNGCTQKARAAISYQQGREGMVTGTRAFSDTTDTYTFGKERLVFPNSTGNTTGKYFYTDSRGNRKSVTLECDVRDYEYSDC